MGSMGDPRHKRPPKKADLFEVTSLFLKQVEAKLAENALHNEQHRLKKGDDGYRPYTHADLVEATGANQNAISNLLGGVRPGTKTKRPKRSRLVGQLRELLGIPPLIRFEAEVPPPKAAVLERVRALSPEKLAQIERDLDEIEK